MKTFCESLREHAIDIINFKKKKMKLLTNEHQKSYKNATISWICKEKFGDKHAEYKNIVKLRTIVIIQKNLEKLHVGYVI